MSFQAIKAIILYYSSDGNTVTNVLFYSAVTTKMIAFYSFQFYYLFFNLPGN